MAWSADWPAGLTSARLGDSLPKPGFAALRLPRFNEGARRAGVGRGAAGSASVKGATTPQTRLSAFPRRAGKNEAAAG